MNNEYKIRKLIQSSINKDPNTVDKIAKSIISEKINTIIEKEKLKIAKAIK